MRNLNRIITEVWPNVEAWPSRTKPKPSAEHSTMFGVIFYKSALGATGSEQSIAFLQECSLTNLTPDMLCGW